MYANYVGITTWKSSCPQLCDAEELYSILNNKSPFPQGCRFSDDFQTITYKGFEKVSLKNAALLRNHLLPYNVTNKTTADELTATIKGAMQSVDNKPFDYYLCGDYDIEFFDDEGFF
ncbi:TPA: hypothetical protein ACP61A_004718 [Escherichia coli]